jgi:hypothetical protein
MPATVDGVRGVADGVRGKPFTSITSSPTTPSTDRLTLMSGRTSNFFTGPHVMSKRRNLISTQ